MDRIMMDISAVEDCIILTLSIRFIFNNHIHDFLDLTLPLNFSKIDMIIYFFNIRIIKDKYICTDYTHNIYIAELTAI